MMARLAGWDGVPENGVIYVPYSYAKIQWAVDNATAGDTIIVRDGSYTENVDVNKRLTIRSENCSATCIVDAANPGDHVFEVTANYVNISGFTIADATEYSKVGVYIDSVGHCNISDNIVSHNNLGIYLDNSSSNTITNNIANMNEDINIILSLSTLNTLINNTASYSGSGIYIPDSSYNMLLNNTVSENLYGIYMIHSCNNNLTGNIANANTGELGGIHLWNSNENKLTMNNVSNNSQYGIYLEDSSNNLIYNNYFNNTNNSFDDGTNIWNTTTTTGPYIVGGPFIGGNYWSDYIGIDNNSDGFGDTAYNVPGGTNKDHLPLVPMCGDLDGNCIVNIMDMRLLMMHVNDPDGYPVDSWAGNVDGSGGIGIVDVQLLLTHVFDPVGHALMCG